MPFQIFSRPVAGVVVAAGLLAAACGSETAPVIDASAQVDSTAESTTSSDSTASPDSTADAEVEGPGVEPSESEEEAAADVGNHLFPDLETLNVKDGANLNLASELAGGDTPVLLWFYAPH